MGTKTKKKFDTVKMMREIRDRISTETQDMTFEQLKKYIEEQTKGSKLKRERKQTRK